MKDHDKSNAMDAAMAAMGCFETQKLTRASTKQFMVMARDSEQRNHGPHIDKLAKAIDPKGWHLMMFQMLHTDYEFRTWWFVKLKDRIEPISIMMDIGFDVFNKNHEIYEVEQVQIDELMEEK